MTKEQRIRIIEDTNNRFGRQEWHRGTAVHDSYPTTGEPTLEVRVNYIPLFEKKVVMEHAQKYNLALKFTIIDKNGKPVE